MAIKLKESLDAATLEDKFVLFDCEEGKFIEMNDVGRVIIEDVKENNDFDAYKVVEKIMSNYDCQCDKNEIYEDVNKFVNDLIEIGVLITV